MSPVTAPALTRRQLNRATLARQMLLDRVDTTALDAIRFLVGLQARRPDDHHASAAPARRDRRGSGGPTVRGLRVTE